MIIYIKFNFIIEIYLDPGTFSPNAGFTPLQGFKLNLCSLDEFI